MNLYKYITSPGCYECISSPACKYMSTLSCRQAGNRKIRQSIIEELLKSPECDKREIDMSVEYLYYRRTYREVLLKLIPLASQAKKEYLVKDATLRHDFDILKVILTTTNLADAVKKECFDYAIASFTTAILNARGRYVRELVQKKSVLLIELLLSHIHDFFPCLGIATMETLLTYAVKYADEENMMEVAKTFLKKFGPLVRSLAFLIPRAKTVEMVKLILSNCNKPGESDIFEWKSVIRQLVAEQKTHILKTLLEEELTKELVELTLKESNQEGLISLLRSTKEKKNVR